VELTLLTVQACPGAAMIEERLAAALTAHPDAIVQCRVITDEAAASAAGMHGSPTLLVNGADPFALPGQPPSLSCRMYRDASGRLSRAPSLDALRQALAAAVDDRAGAR
jgi:hypothetical protein